MRTQNANFTNFHFLLYFAKYHFKNSLLSLLLELFLSVRFSQFLIKKRYFWSKSALFFQRSMGSPKVILQILIWSFYNTKNPFQIIFASLAARAILVSPFFAFFNYKTAIFFKPNQQIILPGHGKSKNKVTNLQSILLLPKTTKEKLRNFLLLWLPELFW
jgi:hypothetical protein